MSHPELKAEQAYVDHAYACLEFDHVVVVEPAAIAEAGEQGLRELYVALTRPTKTLVVVHARPLPHGLSVDG
jgi:DNA helicase IV